MTIFQKYAKITDPKRTKNAKKTSKNESKPTKTNQILWAKIAKICTFRN